VCSIVLPVCCDMVVAELCIFLLEIV